MRILGVFRCLALSAMGLVGLALVPGPELGPGSAFAQSPSFDCNRATTATDRAICANRTLSLLDRQMGPLYRQARGATGDRRQFDILSRRWIRARNRCGANVRCLTRLYVQRRTDLLASLGSSPRELPKTTPVPERKPVVEQAPAEPAPEIATRTVDPASDPEAAFILQQIDALDPGTSLTITEGWCTEYIDDVVQKTDQCRSVMIDECSAQGDACRKDAEFRLQNGDVVALSEEANAIQIDGREVRSAGQGCWQDLDGKREFCLSLLPSVVPTPSADGSTDTSVVTSDEPAAESD